MALAIGVAGCAHHSANPPRTHSSPTPAPPMGSRVEPYGQLSAAEYQAIVREYRRLHPLSNGRDDPDMLRRGRAACASLREPATKLVALVRADCDNAIAFFSALRALEHADGDCAGAARNECVRKRYLAMARAISRTRSGAVAINAELRQRGITGLCARSIGITAPQVAAYARAEQAARDGADAAAAGDSLGFQTAAQELTDALSAGASGPDPLLGIVRGCRHAGRPRPLPRLPGGGVNA